MSKGYRISSEIKSSILQRIKEEGVNANRAANEAGISPKTVYNWLSKTTEQSGISWLEYNRLKKENQQLKEIIGGLTLNAVRIKKN